MSTYDFEVHCILQGDLKIAYEEEREHIIKEIDDAISAHLKENEYLDNDKRSKLIESVVDYRRHPRLEDIAKLTGSVGFLYNDICKDIIDERNG